MEVEWKAYFDIFKRILHNGIAANQWDNFDRAFERTPAPVTSCESCPDGNCIWLNHKDEVLRRCLLTSFKDDLLGHTRIVSPHERREHAYDYMNRVIPGLRSEYRTLPNCVIAGIRGFIHGDNQEVRTPQNPQDLNAFGEEENDETPIVALSASSAED